MAGQHTVSIDGTDFQARRGETLLDAALRNGVDIPFDCRSGYCGTCCVRLVSGTVHGGESTESGVVHACQCRISGDAIIERRQAPDMHAIDGKICSVRALSSDVVEVGIESQSSLHYRPGQYAQVRFRGYPSRPFSITLPLNDDGTGRSLFFHIRQMADGRVTRDIGKRIRIGHRVTVEGPFGSAHFRPNSESRLILVATSTGFAPIWSIAVAALREAPTRMMMVIAGGRSIGSLYMGQALERLTRFPNVLVLPVCSTPQSVSRFVRQGRPTDFLPRMIPSDVLHVCGAQGMVDAVKAAAVQAGATCYADPFIPTAEEAIAPYQRTGTIDRLAKSFSWPIESTTPRRIRLSDARPQTS